MTIKEVYENAMRVQTEEEAADIFASLIRFYRESGEIPQADIVASLKSNLGYFAGYYDNATRERVERLYKCEHPFFGAIAIKGPPTEEEALRIGYRLGKAMSERKADDHE